jgi:hypothetical protein
MSMFKKPSRREIVTSAAVLLVAAISLRFVPELYALGWHVLNGNQVIVGDYEIPIPLRSIASQDGSHYFVHTGTGRIHSWTTDKWARINTISYSAQPHFSAQERKAANVRLAQVLDANITSSEVVVAGSAMTCFKSTYPSNPSSVTIDCVPNDAQTRLEVFCTGDPRFEPLFYAQLRQVRKKSEGKTQ